MGQIKNIKLHIVTDIKKNKEKKKKKRKKIRNVNKKRYRSTSIERDADKWNRLIDRERTNNHDASR